MAISIVLAILSYTALALIPVLTRYSGCISGKVSGWGFKAEVTVDGRKTEN